MNDEFDYRGGVLHAEGVSLEALAAEHGTPSYVYSRASIERAWRGFDSALAGQPHLVCYAVKANGNLAVLDVLARLGSGFDIVSAGELERVIAAGGDPGKTVFAGVGKSRAEMERALAAGVRGFNVESPAELERLAAVATATGTTARVSLRVNPDVDARTHPYISTGLRDNKFGIPIDEAPALYEVASRMGGLEVAGVDCHIGSQLTDIAPLLAAMDRVLALVDTVAAAGIRLHHVNLGGGMGVRYRDESPRAAALCARDPRPGGVA